MNPISNSASTHASMAPRELALAGVALLAALAVPAALALFIDERTLLGVSVWHKPLKFDLSLALHLLTLQVLLRCLASPLAPKPAALLRLALLVSVFCVLVEAMYITLQAARGRASHFNQQTALESFMYTGVMGTAALLILAGAFVVGWLLWRHGDAQAPAGLRWGGAAGLMLGSLATLVVVIPLSSGMVDGPGHWVGGVRTDASGLPLTGWSTSGGDLRVPHFFATHMMQALPLVGWLADRFDPHRAIKWVAVAAVLAIAVVAATFVQALAGRALFPA